jgi:hypothetical protein
MTLRRCPEPLWGDGIGFMPSQNVPVEQEARLLYVAMTS